jgi:hypothetical protein
MPQNTTKITISLGDLAKRFGVNRIDTAEADEDERGDLIQLSDTDQTYKITVTRNNLVEYGPLPEGTMTPAIDGGNLVITFR